MNAPRNSPGTDRTNAKGAADLWDWAESRTGPLSPDTAATWIALLDELDAATTAAHTIMHFCITAVLHEPPGTVMLPPAEVHAAAELNGFEALPAAFWFLTHDVVGPLARDTAPGWARHLNALAAHQRTSLAGLRAVVADAATPSHGRPIP